MNSFEQEFSVVRYAGSSMGEAVQLRVSGDVVIDGRFLAAKGAPIRAQITLIGQRGMVGLVGDLSFSPTSVQALIHFRRILVFRPGK